MSVRLPGHVVTGVLRELPGHRRVLRTTVVGSPCVTRVLLSHTIEPSRSSLIEQIALFGRGSLAGLPEPLALTLDGYRVAARLPRAVESPWTWAVAAGVTDDRYVYVTTRWMEGTPLHQLPQPMPDAVRLRVVTDVARILLDLHEHNAAYGDLKLENLVLTPEGRVVLIDLDTMREVGGPTVPAVTRDVTRSWAAPEQLYRQQTWLASDLWAFARLIQMLWPDGPPPAWMELLRACQLPDPLRRPTTRCVFLRLNGSWDVLTDWQGLPTPPPATTRETVRDAHEPTFGHESTERVPEASASNSTSTSTERVPEASTERVPDAGGIAPQVPFGHEILGRPDAVIPPTPVVPSFVADTPKSQRRSLGCVYLSVVAMVAPVVLCSGAWLWWDHTKVTEANAQADEVMAALKAYKTRPELNRDMAQRAVLRNKAQDAHALRETPHTTAVYGLAFVWSQGWQDANRRWDADAWAEADALTPDSRQPEALLARATLDGARCRLQDKDPSAAAACEQALKTLVDFNKVLDRGEEQNWLRVEAAWTETLTRAAMLFQVQQAGLPGADSLLTDGLQTCASAEAWLPWAPVNGPELLQDCLRLAGAAPDLSRYLQWANLLIEQDRADGDLKRATLWHLYAAAGRDCEEKVDVIRNRRGDYQYKGPEWCLAVGHLARGDRISAIEAATAGQNTDPSRPWDQLLPLLGSP